ncbi:hypothetical protein IV203_017352 [Nitzschia inconspicua]|uniref:Uncharacterized protein n=1 Tax=Nitzschia inconspicua TaxID=303405 RepID=A0A9K3KRZ2_9STRA|nr:hypothetical protein IV203_017352 [Nitzschia inconspicua]
MMVTKLSLSLSVTAIAAVVAVQQAWLTMTTALSVGREGRILQLPTQAGLTVSSDRIGGSHPTQRRCYRFTGKTFQSLRSKDDNHEVFDDEDVTVSMNGVSSATTERQQSKGKHNNRENDSFSSSSVVEVTTPTSTTTTTSTTNSLQEQLRSITVPSIGVSPIIENTTSTTKNCTNSIPVRPPELSPYYRRDVDDFFHKPIVHPERIARLLQRRFHARRERHYDTVKQLDQALQNDHGVFVYDTPNLWTRRRIPPRAYQERVQTRKQRQQQESPQPDVALYTIDPITCRLSQQEIHQFLEQYQQYFRNGNFQAATLIRYQAKLQGMFFNDNDSS